MHGDAGRKWQARLLLEFPPDGRSSLKVARRKQLPTAAGQPRADPQPRPRDQEPAGGIRGSAQLLERELGRPQLREYTQVIIAEADRLQDLMNRLLTLPPDDGPTQLNLHDVLERVRA